MTSDLTTLRQSWYVGDTGDWTALRGHVTFPSRAQVMELAVQLARPVSGHVIEFGVWKGHSIRVIRDELWRSGIWDRAQRRKRIYACDSFEGLPEHYEHLPAGTFATPLPRLRGVRIVKGYFDQSLTPELAQEIGRLSIAHFDADLYSSTVTALNWVTPLLHAGSLLVFDEFSGEDPAEERALKEWIQRTGTKVTLLAAFGREPSGKGEQSDRRTIFQVVGDAELTKAPALLPTRLRRRLFSNR